MATRSQPRQLAEQRASDAEALLAAKKRSGGDYLVGCAVECGPKAYIDPSPLSAAVCRPTQIEANMTAEAQGDRLPGFGWRSFKARYNERMANTHGWEVALSCPRCGLEAPPVFDGWTPTSAINFGDEATIYADIHCLRCGADLKEAAGAKLRELFASVITPRGNVLAISIALVVVPEVLGAVLIPLAKDWRELSLHLMRTPLYYLAPAIIWFNWQTHSVRHRCACGQPAYKFMGLLGRSACYRCSTCGRLVRIRD